ncbi:MAG: NAD-dependent epimerase/dehydratase family protein [Planctomycetales bacterium]
MAMLVTGATGLLGNNIVRLLLARGEKVRVLVRNSYDRRTLDGLDVEIIEGDIRDTAKVQLACQGMQVIIHAAGWVQIGRTGMSEARAVNIEGSANVATSARQVGARMIHVSSMSAMGIGSSKNPANEQSPRAGQVPCPYTLTKREGEEVVQQKIIEGLDAVIINPGFMLGPWDWKPSSGKMVLDVAEKFTPLAPRGGCSVCDVRDVASGILAAVEKGHTGKNYLLTGHNMPYIELWNLIAETTETRKPNWRLTRPGMYCVGMATDLISKLRGRELSINSVALRVTSQYHYYSCERARSELGYQVRPASHSVCDAWQWFGEHGYVG